ncbi:hypothetical protein [Gaiella occulta]|uniref:hypothetical protein n=1 Tax=Gaiella occulta TaxID=1002870 RepID=UPI0011C080FF|nr:hypothetical protein [Gaiella occulta]
MRVVIDGASRKALYLAQHQGAVLAGDDVNAALLNRRMGEIVDVVIEHSRPIAPVGFPQSEALLFRNLSGVLSDEQFRHAILFVREAEHPDVRDQRLTMLAQLVSGRAKTDVVAGAR